MEDKAKTEYLQVKIDPETKKKFFDKCADKAITPSVWIRKKVQEFVEENAQ